MLALSRMTSSREAEPALSSAEATAMIRMAPVWRGSFTVLRILPSRSVRAASSTKTAGVSFLIPSGIALLRMTADGAIRPCLFSDAEYSVRDALRAGDDERVLAVYRNAIAHKPQEHEVIAGTERFMSQIGG